MSDLLAEGEQSGLVSYVRVLTVTTHTLVSLKPTDLPEGSQMDVTVARMNDSRYKSSGPGRKKEAVFEMFAQ